MRSARPPEARGGHCGSPHPVTSPINGSAVIVHPAKPVRRHDVVPVVSAINSPVEQDIDSRSFDQRPGTALATVTNGRE
jgi:hypothetical protein